MKKVKAIIKDDVCIKFCNEKEFLFLETDASSVGLGVSPADKQETETQKEKH